MAKIGDTVRYLNNVGGGKIVRIEGNLAIVDDDGFETPVLLRECVVVRKAEDDMLIQSKLEQEQKTQTPTAKTPQYIPPVEETSGGDILNIVLGFEPTDRLRLTQSDFDVTLINDSNYFLFFNLSTRESDNDKWTTRHASIVEPNTELWLGTFERSQLMLFDHLCLQYVAYKTNKEFTLKEPGLVKIKFDTSKFSKLHCLQPNRYFDKDVIAIEFVKDDTPLDRKYPTEEQLRRLSESVRTSAKSLAKNSDRPKHTTKPLNSDEPLVIDLHIDELVDSTVGMSKADMLNMQVDKFREVMDRNLRNYGKKIIFIHGKGEGVLRQALFKELNHRYKGHDVQDASFLEYGFGATQVTIRQHPEKFNGKRRL